MLYELQCNVSDKDFYAFNKYTLLRAPEFKKELRRLRMFVPIFFALSLLIICLIDFVWADLIFDICLFGAISVAWMLIVKPFYMFLVDIRFKRLQKKKELPYTPQMTMQFYEEYFTDITSDTKAEMKYSVVKEVCLTESGDIYLYHNARTGHIIPFDTFETDAQRNEFLQFIKAKTSCTIES